MSGVLVQVDSGQVVWGNGTSGYRSGCPRSWHKLIQIRLSGVMVQVDTGQVVRGHGTSGYRSGCPESWYRLIQVRLSKVRSLRRSGNVHVML